MVITLQLSVSYLRRALTQTTKLCQGILLLLHRSSEPISFSHVVQRRPIPQLLLRAGASIHESIIDKNVDEMITPKSGTAPLVTSRSRGGGFPAYARDTDPCSRHCLAAARVSRRMSSQKSWNTGPTSDTTSTASPGRVQKSNVSEQT